MNYNTIYKKSKEIEYTFLEEETVILIPKTGEFFSLNKTGTKIFKLINGKNSIKNIIKRVLQHYIIEEINAKKDVTNLILELLKINIIKDDKKVKE